MHTVCPADDGESSRRYSFEFSQAKQDLHFPIFLHKSLAKLARKRLGAYCRITGSKILISMTVKLLKKSVIPFLPYVVFFCTGFSFRKRRKKGRRRSRFSELSPGEEERGSEELPLPGAAVSAAIYEDTRGRIRKSPKLALVSSSSCSPLLPLPGRAARPGR